MPTERRTGERYGARPSGTAPPGIGPSAAAARGAGKEPSGPIPGAQGDFRSSPGPIAGKSGIRYFFLGEHVEPVLVFGASRGIGLELARHLREQGVRVVAMVRAESSIEHLKEVGVEVVRGDALEPRDVAAAFDALGPGGHVVSTLGGSLHQGPVVDFEGNVHVIDEAARREVGRFVFVTSIGCGEMMPFMYDRIRAILGKIVEAKTRAEEHLVRTSLAWTIVRPGGLRSEPATGRGILSEDPEIHGFIHRADVALLVARILRDPATVGRKFAAIDSAFAKCVNPIEPFPLAE